MTEEVIVWHDLKVERPDPDKNKGPLITKRRGQFPFGVWWRMAGIDEKSGEKYKYWSKNNDADIEYWAEIKGPPK